MATLVTKDRLVVPNFRRFSETAAMSELDSHLNRMPAQLKIDFDGFLTDWLARPSMGVAGDIISAALISDAHDHEAVQQAANYVSLRESEATAILADAVRRIQNRDTTAYNSSKALPRLKAFIEGYSRGVVRAQIHDLKSRLSHRGDDAILQTELARLYLVLGQPAPAQRRIEHALSLAPTNRYVLRSAARLFAHCKDPERSYDLLRTNARTLHDPWLLSAELACSQLVNRANHAIKKAKRMLSAGDYSPLSLAELRAGVGSFELLAGDRRSSRRLLEAALEQPNDNALAQIEWALSKDRHLLDVDVSDFNVKNRYEALALEAFNNERWEDVITHCEAWLVDTPFARRPVMLASHVAAVVLDQYDTAGLFCEAGRLARRRDLGLLNNHAYALALGGDADKALAELSEADISKAENERTRACLTATKGLAHFRSGNLNAGRENYLAALELARGIKDQSLHQLAVLHYVREELLAKQVVDQSMVQTIREMRVHHDDVTIEILRRKVLALLDVPAAG